MTYLAFRVLDSWTRLGRERLVLEKLLRLYFPGDWIAGLAVRRI